MLTCNVDAIRNLEKNILAQIESLLPRDLCGLIIQFLPDWSRFSHKKSIGFRGYLWTKTKALVMPLVEDSFFLHECSKVSGSVTLSEWTVSDQNTLVIQRARVLDKISFSYQSRMIVGIAYGYLCSIRVSDSSIHFLDVSNLAWDTECSKQFLNLVTAYMQGEVACVLLEHKLLLLDGKFVERELALPSILKKELQCHHMFRLVCATVHANGTVEICLWNMKRSTLIYLRGQDELVIQSIISPTWAKYAESISFSNGVYLVVKDIPQSTQLLLCTRDAILLEINFDLSISLETWLWNKDSLHVLGVKDEVLHDFVFN
jgi:hypothetical protein